MSNEHRPLRSCVQHQEKMIKSVMISSARRGVSVASLFFLGISLVATAAWGDASEFLIRDYGVGYVSIHMTPEQAAKRYPAKRVKWWSPYTNVRVIDIDPSPDQNATPPSIRMHLDRDQKSIWLITIADRRYHTEKGITIGSSFGALRKAHPRLQIRMEEGEMDRFIVAEIVGQGIACQLNYDDATWQKMSAQADRQNIPISIIPDEKTIQSLSVYQPQPPSKAPSSSSD